MSQVLVSRRKCPGGFTLAELLIALAILGVIAAFSIPKLLATQQDERKRSVFLETIAAVNGIAYQGWQTNALRSGTVQWDYYKVRLNGLQLCENAMDEGCWTSGVDLSFNEENDGGVLLANGAMITGFCQSGCGDTDEIFIDWNGSQTPNSLMAMGMRGKDILILRCNYGTTTLVSAFLQLPIKPGTCGPHDGIDPNAQFYANLFDPDSDLDSTGNQWD